MELYYGNLPDDELKEVRLRAQRHLRAIEQEMARRRSAELGAPTWYCPHCNEHYRNTDGICFFCDRTGQKMEQGALVSE